MRFQEQISYMVAEKTGSSSFWHVEERAFCLTPSDFLCKLHTRRGEWFERVQGSHSFQLRYTIFFRESRFHGKAIREE